MDFAEEQLIEYLQYCEIQLMKTRRIPTLPFQYGSIEKMTTAMLSFQTAFEELKNNLIRQSTVISGRFKVNSVPFTPTRYKLLHVTNETLQAFISANAPSYVPYNDIPLRINF
jgi:hypothetical protein